jgi:uncharacterized protein (TIGR03437 family)
LQAGTYNADVSISATGATNNPLTVRVTLVVKGVPPVISATPATAQFDYATGAPGATPATATVSIKSSGQSAAVSLAVTGAPWLKLSKTAGFTIAGSPLAVDLSVDPAAVATLAPKTYPASLVITPNDTAIKPITVVVQLVVSAGLPVLSKIWPTDVAANSGPITLTLTGANYLNTSVVSIGGTDLPATSVTLITNGVLMASMPASFLTTPGTYAVSIKNGSFESTRLDFKVAAPGPSIAAIANAASFFSADKVSPGEIVSVFGSAFGLAELTAGSITSGVQDSRIADTELQFNNGSGWTAAPLILASANQINAVVPFELAPGTTSVRVATAVSTATPSYSTTIPLSVVAANPGIFTADSSGLGQAAVLNAVVDASDPTIVNYSLNSAKNPAAKGSTIVLYMTGGGHLNPAGVNGKIVSGTPPVTAVTPAVTIKGVDCTPDYSGAVSGSVQGLVQINVKIPADMTAVAAIPLTVSFGGNASQRGVTIAVK